MKRTMIYLPEETHQGLRKLAFEGNTSIAELIRKAKLFISNSTGTIHIAAAVNTFTIGFFSPITAENKVRWAPYTDKKKIFSPVGYTGEDSMDSIEVDEVFAFVKKYLQTG